MESRFCLFNGQFNGLRWARLAWALPAWTLLVTMLGSCASMPVNQILLMPAPDVYDAGIYDPFTDHDPIKSIPYGGILYATDRKPSQENGGSYQNDRGHILRLGIAQIEVGAEGMTWEEARRISLLKNRTEEYPLKVTGVREIGVLEGSVNVLNDDEIEPEQHHPASREFARQVNEKLAISQRKDIYIYVHGYKVVFENPLLVASELWHYLGYEGVFIAFSWPSTPSTLAYAGDLETAVISASNLRILIEYLSKDTDVERIHIIGYSAGTRVVTQALHQMALIRKNCEPSETPGKTQVGHVILTASDVDRDLFGSYLVDGFLDISGKTTVYMSTEDSALGMSEWVFGRKRMGQMWTEDVSVTVTDELKRIGNLVLIDASGAEGSAGGNGHAYFRKSPWISSDVLTTLIFDLKPEDRGLDYRDNMAVWAFPQDYIQRLRTALMKVQAE